LKKSFFHADQLGLFSFGTEEPATPTIATPASTEVVATCIATNPDGAAFVLAPTEQLRPESPSAVKDGCASILAVAPSITTLPKFEVTEAEPYIQENPPEFAALGTTDAEALYDIVEPVTPRPRQREVESEFDRARREEEHRLAYEARSQGMVMTMFEPAAAVHTDEQAADEAGLEAGEQVGQQAEQAGPEIEAAAPEVLSAEMFAFGPRVLAADSEVLTETLASDDQEPSLSSVTFHKHGKLLLVKANDVRAADVWREISSRLKNERMTNLQYFDSLQENSVIPSPKNLHELWRWVECGLEEHPYRRILESYGISVNISPSLAGYMRREKRRVAIRKTPYPCYESSPDDISECVISGMILKCKEELPDGPFKKGGRYLVKTLTESGEVEVYEEALQARALLAADAEVSTLSKDQIRQYFEDSDKFVVTENIRDLYPELIAKVDARLATLPIGQDGRLFEHSHQDVVCEVLKSDYLCSKDMRMGKSREAVAACELIGSRSIAWIGPSMANIDIPAEFRAAGVENFTEIEKLADLAAPTKYHIMTFDFLKKESDPLGKVRRGNKSKTWLRSMGEGNSICDCPHCSQPLERPVPVVSFDGRIVRTTWTLYNGYLCRNPECVWTEIAKPRKPSRKSGKQKIAPTPWHRAGEASAVTHKGGYVDWQRKQHASCGDHVGRKRFCPKCGQADAAWQPAIYKRIKKNYATVVIDEIHMTMDENSLTSTAALDMRGKHHIGNSGTPMSKNLVDMYPQLMWIFHTKSAYFPFDRATGKAEYRERFCENIRIQREGTDRSHYKTLPYARDPVDFWNFSAPLLVRRTRMDKVYQASLTKLGLKLPEERTFLTPVRMVPPQALLLSTSLDQFQRDFAEYCKTLEEEGKSLNSHIVMTMMSRMKVAATIPGFLNKPGMPVIYYGGEIDPQGIGGKGIALSSLVPAKIMEGKKIVIMSQYVMMRERLAQKFAHLHPVMLPSGTVAQKRKVLDEFRRNPDRHVTLVGAKQVCLGVELNCADVLINVDLMWEAAAQKQALARLMGATTYDRIVENYILNSEHSMDGYVYDVFYGKIAGMEQALDKRVVTRSAQSVNWVAFADTLISQQAALQSYLRETADEEAGIVMPSLDDIYLERVA
jgi:hypothetical protein